MTITATPLRSVANFIRGITFKPEDVCSPSEPGAVVCMRTKNVQSDIDLSDLIAIPEAFVRRAEQNLVEGDLLVSSANSWNLVGKACWVPKLSYRATAGGFISILRCDRDLVFPRYFYHWVTSGQTQHDLRSCGRQTTNISNLDFDRALDLEIPLPHKNGKPDLDEQKRIAAILDKADAIRRKLQQSLRLSDDFLRSVFLDMFGDPVTNPKGWPVHKSGDLFADKPRLGTTRPATGAGYLVVRVGEIGNENVIFSKCGRVEQTDEELKRYRLEKGDILIARAIGSRDQLGKCSFFSGYKEIVVGDSHVMRLRPENKKCDPYWLYFLLSSPSGKALLQSKGGATAVQFNINGTQASDLDIPLPPMKLQMQFVAVASTARKEIEHKGLMLIEAENLFSSLQQRAFRGEL